MDKVSLAGMPMPLSWLFPPRRWQTDGLSLTLEAGERTDWFVDPSGVESPIRNAPALVGDALGDYLFSARVRVSFRATFDAGALLLYAGERYWAKLCFEYSPQKEPTIVTVVTRDVSDDANSFAIQAGEAWLRIGHIGSAHAFHASTDGRDWRLVRYFVLPNDGPEAIGFESQSPTGEGCTVTFDEISFETRRLGALRDGS